MTERSLVLVKPDGVMRGLSGEIIRRLETAGLKVVALKLVWPSKELAAKHYPLDKEWYENAWRNTKKGYEEKGMKFTETPLELGTRIRNALMTAITMGPVVAMVIEGNDAVACVRKIVGATAPNRADPSTIRGMYSTDSYALADGNKRALRNLIHASDTPANGEKELAVWFTKKEIVDYKRVDESLIY